jgi:hypothetical protein
MATIAKRAWPLLGLLAPVLAVSAWSAVEAPPAMPPVHGPLAPPTGADRQPRATVMLAHYRYDDILWENDRTAHRIYGQALEAAEPPSSSGIDAWGKNVRWPFMDRQLRTGDQHAYHGEGLDFYNVNSFRGAGGLGIWQDNKLWVSRNYRSYKILQNGPDVARFQVTYAPWPVDVDRRVWETRRFSLPLGTNFTRTISTIGSDKPGTMLVGIGIGKHPTSDANGTLHVDRARGTLSWWGPEDPVKGAMAIALMVDPKMIAEVREDSDNYLVLLRVEPGVPFVYYMGAGWDKGPDFRNEAQWDAYVGAQRPDFDPSHP